MVPWSVGDEPEGKEIVDVLDVVFGLGLLLISFYKDFCDVGGDAFTTGGVLEIERVELEHQPSEALGFIDLE